MLVFFRQKIRDMVRSPPSLNHAATLKNNLNGSNEQPTSGLLCHCTRTRSRSGLPWFANAF
ncbi:hypothetical protein PN441_17270 [Spirulina major CS-329]|uniref:hypothetical protein n=1 Tax=Spirulina TaxID=1154 RepID=UPI00232BC8D5|nr:MULTISPECIES: hypothetical protein [Spirulina]MDB9494581.1 hypothetical protein [Spirulina subsalsa CS-330]MDB9504831.1 hypothetical protein [Spirulina major CS-329]